MKALGALAWLSCNASPSESFLGLGCSKITWSMDTSWNQFQVVSNSDTQMIKNQDEGTVDVRHNKPCHGKCFKLLCLLLLSIHLASLPEASPSPPDAYTSPSAHSVPRHPGDCKMASKTSQKISKATKISGNMWVIPLAQKWLHFSCHFAAFLDPGIGQGLCPDCCKSLPEGRMLRRSDPGEC